MKQYVIDELRFQDYEKLKEYLGKKFKESDLGELYWIPLEHECLTGIQAEHTRCQPFYFAVELNQTKLACELFIRTQSRMRCECMGYADEKQRNWIIHFIDGICNQLDIIT